MKAHRIAAAGVWIALMIGFGPATPLPATASADPCPDAEVVFARGTDEPPGLGRVGNPFVGALRSKADGRSVGAYAVNYPATYNFLEAVNGANDARGHIQYMVDTCPNTRLVLGGYSQGAAVMDILTAAPVAGVSLSQPLPPEVADHVAAAALFGNPSQHLGNLMTELSPQFAAKTIELCNGSDPVCADGGRNWSAHTGYEQSGMIDQAAQFAADRL